MVMPFAPQAEETLQPIMGSGALVPLEGPPDRPIDLLKPGSELHQKVLDKLMMRLDYSERHMQEFYHRWAVNEQKAQAYIHLEDHEQMLKDMNESCEAPQPSIIVVPFTWAAISTIVTLVAVFLNKRPHFELGSMSPEGVQNAKHMEMVLQYNCDHTRMVRRLYQKFMDICVYGVGAVSTKWCVKKAHRTVRTKLPGGQLETSKEFRTVYQGNEVSNIDPYNFFPDPRVPMSEVNRSGEFAFWRDAISRLGLLKDAREYNYAWVEDIPKTRPRSDFENYSKRNAITKGASQPGLSVDRAYEGKFEDDFVQVDQGTCWIVPKDWGLGDSEDPELWIFSVGNKKQVFQAEPFDADHAQHPVAVSEPFGLGYGFGQPSPTDFVTPIQDLVSALVNTHLVNVRSVLNDCFVYDPSAIESQDMKDMGPGRRYRLKPSAFGRDVRSIIQQIPVQDVTAQHMADAQMFMNVGLMLLGLNQNMIGASTPSSRRSATESRITAEASASRLSLLSRLTSGQGVIDMVEQMILNIQQNIDSEFTLQILGEKGMMESVLVMPENLVGDFYYPIHDGTLPMDKVGLLDVWKELIGVVLQDEQLRMEWDVSKMVEYAATLGGAQNAHMMRRQPQMQFGTDQDLQEGAQSGNLVPAPPGLVNPMLAGLGNPAGVR
jgi:hypothetical protein